MTQALEKKETMNPCVCEGTRPAVERAPDTDIYERDDAIVIVADVPGVDQKDVEVTLEQDELVFSARVDEPAPADMERLYGAPAEVAFRRSFRIAADIDRAEVSARVKNGTLTITLPKSPESQPRRIEVKGE